MPSILSEPVTITLDGKEFQLHNTPQVRKDLCLRCGGIRPVLQAIQDFNEYQLALIISIASGKAKKTEQIFEMVIAEGPKSVCSQLGDYALVLLGIDDEDEEQEAGNEEATES